MIRSSSFTSELPLLSPSICSLHFKSRYIVHYCWLGEWAYFESANATASQLNDNFRQGDTITVKLVASGRAYSDQIGFTLVHGKNPEYDSPDNSFFYKARSRIRYDTFFVLLSLQLLGFMTLNMLTLVCLFLFSTLFRYGVTDAIRDGTVLTTNWMGYLNPSDTYFSRKYLIVVSLFRFATSESSLQVLMCCSCYTGHPVKYGNRCI